MIMIYEKQLVFTRLSHIQNIYNEDALTHKET